LNLVGRSESGPVQTRICFPSDFVANSGADQICENDNREMFQEMPVRVEYSLTLFARKLRPVLRPLDSWARTHLPDRNVASKPN
jgi:hypothetical protein